MALVPQVDLITLTAWLTEARSKYHQMMLAGGVVEVQVDGYLTKFNRSNAGDLRSYIARLESQIAAFGAAAPYGGAIGVIF